MTESLAEAIRRVDDERWEVATGQVDDRVHVYPVRGLMTVNGWPNRYPRTDRGVRRAVRRVQRWCDRENAKLDKGATLLGRYERGSQVG